MHQPGREAVSRTFEDGRRWMSEGTALFLKGLDGLDEAGLDAASILPGWTRRHLVAHVAANADALSNLVHWAATGVETPMYASPDERARGIEEGAKRPTADLRSWANASAEKLGAAMDALTDVQWANEVRTAQGRTVPTTEVPWMRSREVCVHAVDLGVGVGFDQLSADFLAALGDDIVGKRNAAPAVALQIEATDSAESWTLSGDGDPAVVKASLADAVAYLSGRPVDLATVEGAPAPVLPAWL